MLLLADVDKYSFANTGLYKQFTSQKDALQCCFMGPRQHLRSYILSLLLYFIHKMNQFPENGISFVITPPLCYDVTDIENQDPVSI